ncbi:FHA domain-containing protein [Fulvivirgaceae bacterium BMA12]|uniref:FHA domain-containing protein n=1 Tax=Agaribacillus aureus TaxID=3051825 RepID=A0ABT8L2I3_9BACT|nr:FHA domain-containing protein [Fulvivirgaceae bacterium BMA12]
MHLPSDIKIGKDPSNDYVIKGRYVSAFHARVFRKGEEIFIEDLGSTFGTRVNNHIINQPAPLRANDQIAIGYHKLKLRDLLPTPAEKALTFKDLFIPGRTISPRSFRYLLLLLIAYPPLVFFGTPVLLTYLEYFLNGRRRWRFRLRQDLIELPIWELTPYLYWAFGVIGVYVTVVILLNTIRGLRQSKKTN